MHLLTASSFTDSCYKNTFLTEQNFSVFIIKCKEKQRNSIGLSTNIKIIFFNLKLKIKIHHIKNFIHTYYYWSNKHGNVKENISCTSSGILLLSIFETLGQKLEVLLSIFCGTKITLEWITPSPFLDLPPLPLCLTCPLTCKFFQPPSPLLSILKSPYSPILCKLECPLSESFTRVSKGTIKQHRFAQCYFTDSKQRFNKQTGQQCLISCHGWTSCNCKKDLLIL